MVGRRRRRAHVECAAAVGVGAQATPIIDRQYFHSVYFREPSGVLFELASRDIGFDVDEPLESLGQELKLPPQYEGRRAEFEAELTPIVNPRQAGVQRAPNALVKAPTFVGFLSSKAGFRPISGRKSAFDGPERRRRRSHLPK